jgi:hypothetical protein
MRTIIDANCNIGASVYGPKQTPDMLLKSMNKYGIKKSVIIPFTPSDFNYEKANNYAASAVRKRPDRFVGFARIDPRHGKRAIREVDRAVKRKKLQGVKLDPFEQGFQITSEIVDPILDKCSRLDIPVLVEAGYPALSLPIQIGEIADMHPDLAIIMAHGGQLAMSGIGIADALDVIKDTKNVYIETSGVPETGAECLVERAVKCVGAERVIFGTNSPMNDPVVEMSRVEVVNISDSEKDTIFAKSIGHLLEIE